MSVGIGTLHDYLLPEHTPESWLWRDNLQITLDRDKTEGLDYSPAALTQAAQIRWTTEYHAARQQSDVPARFLNQTQTNDAAVKDTVFYYTHGTTDTADDEIVLVIEDFIQPIELELFTIFIH